MKNTIVFLALFILFIPYTQSQNLRQISSREGISNNAVLSLCQDGEGYIWLGTCDGLNSWDANKIQIFQPSTSSSNNLSGNIIEEIRKTTDQFLWIRSNYGLDKFNPKDKSVERHTVFQGLFKFTTRHSDEVFVVQQKNRLYYYNRFNHNFKSVKFEGLNYHDILDFFLDKNDNLWFISQSGIKYTHISYTSEGDLASFSKINTINHPCPLECAYKESDRIYFIDSMKVLYEFDIAKKQKIYKHDLIKDIKWKGSVSCIIKENDDYIISFLTNGVIRLQATPENSIKYVVVPFGIHCGVFSLLKDKNQDIIWIGTDGQGLIQYSKDAIAFRSVTYNDLPYSISKPIRALFVDKENSLWIGTKDDGILRISDYYRCTNFNTTNTQKISTENSDLTNNSVYAFAKSHRNLLWIGGDGPGLNYYSYRDKRIHNIPASKNLRYIHAMYETDDSTLWIATVGNGIFKANLAGTVDYPAITAIENIYINEELNTKNLFFTLYPENEQFMWFGNRGGRAVKYNIKTKKSQIYKFDQKRGPTVNDIFTICHGQEDRMWFGTSSGLVSLSKDRTKKIDINSHLLTNNTVHGILEDSKHNLWLSTNRGLVKYFTKINSAVAYGYSYGLNTIEYSDDAYFRDNNTDMMFFGGINGFVTIEETPFKMKAYAPQVQFKDIQINEELFGIGHMMKGDKLLLSDKQNSFNITVSALDYINGSNYSYLYKLEGYNGNWINNMNSNILPFANLPYGRYVLYVKYHNNMTDTDSPTFSLNIKILPPWYASSLAKILYLFLLFIVTGSFIQYYIRKYQREKLNRQQKMEQEQKEEVYESKLNFFSNITHELSVPLTLINGPCQQIISYEKADAYINKQASTIQRNVYKLNDLILMLNEFRGLGSSEINNQIELLSITQIGREIAQTFTEYSEENGILFKIDIQDSLIWPSDRNNLSNILNTILSNAFKHTSYRGNVELTIAPENDHLILSISYTGISMKREEIDLISDRYKVIDYFEKKGEKGQSFREYLGLAICSNIVKNMQGEIHVESNPNERTNFTVQLPRLETTKSADTSDHIILQDKAFGLPIIEQQEYSYDKNRLTMFIINDNNEILNFVAELFAGEYNTQMFHNYKEAMPLLKQTLPHIILCGVMPVNSESNAFIKSIKIDKQTTHIPIILLSTSQQIDEQISGIESGADICLTLPFNVEYLKAVTEQLLKKNQSLKDYYKSSLSSYELTEGKLLHKDDKEFIDRMLKIIDENITNTDISTQFIASTMGVSIRNLYRRLEGIINQTPTNIIKDYRLLIAERLLTTSKLSIDEIIYKSGFNNRGTFFKCFSTKYGCTPKIYREQKMNDLLPS